jgi:hypothetical protein
MTESEFTCQFSLDCGARKGEKCPRRTYEGEKYCNLHKISGLKKDKERNLKNIVK